MPYRAPVSAIAFALKHAAGLQVALAEGLYGDLDEAMVDQVLVEAGRFATDVIAPLNRVGDKSGTPFKDGAVTTPPGWKQAYTAWAAAGWNGVAAPAEFGGRSDAVPAGGGPGGVGLLPAWRRGDGAVLERGAGLVADTIERRDHVGGEAAGFHQHLIHHGLVEIAVKPFRQRGFQAGGVFERKGDVGNRGAVGHGSS